MPLTDITVRNAKPTEKAQKLSDGGGLYLMVHPNNSKYWRLKYRFLGKEKVLAIGIYPQVSLSDARVRRDDAKKLLNCFIAEADKLSFKGKEYAIWGRAVEKASKLSLVYACSANPFEPTINGDAMQWAIEPV